MEKRNIDSMGNVPKISKIITWQSPDFVYYQKNTQWYIILIAAGIILGVVFYFMDNISGLIMVTLAVVVLLLLAKKKPKNRFYKLNRQGLDIDDKHYSLGDFRSYYVTYVDDYQNLHLEKNRKLSTPVSILLSSEDADKVIKLIKVFLPENTKINTTASDLFSNWFKF